MDQKTEFWKIHSNILSKMGWPEWPSEEDLSGKLEAERAKNRQLNTALANKNNEYKKMAGNMEIEIRLRRKASEDLKAKDALLSLLRPPKFAKNEYLEQTPAKYVFKCMDGDIQIPEYGILRTEFYYKALI